MVFVFHLSLEDNVIVIFNKHLPREKFIGKAYALFVIFPEPCRCLLIHLNISDPIRYDYSGLTIERNQTFIKGFVVECRQADAVLWIETIFLVLFISPGYDVAGK